MNFAELTAKWAGLAAKVETLLARKDPATPDEASELPAFKAELVQIGERLTQADKDLATAKASIESLTTAKAALQTESADLKAQVKTLETAKAELEAKWTDPKFKDAAGAAQLAASQGVPAVSLPTQTENPADTGQPKAGAELTGLARVTAVFAAQSTAKK